MIAAAFLGLSVALAIALITWTVSVVKRDASIVDSVWSLMVLACGTTYAVTLPETGPRAGPVLALAALWAFRLSGYITWRNRGEPEDRRYAAIRKRNEPGFALKSLYLVFGLQAVLAWIVSAPLLAALGSDTGSGWLDALGLALAAFGLAFEALADYQVARFRAQPQNAGKLLDSGLWRYSRHPNYFGEFCVWWGLFLIALAAGGLWAMVSPLLMTVLLLKVSGVALLEKDLRSRRPEYEGYMRRTNAFFPGPRRSA